MELGHRKTNKQQRCLRGALCGQSRGETVALGEWESVIEFAARFRTEQSHSGGCAALQQRNRRSQWHCAARICVRLCRLLPSQCFLAKQRCKLELQRCPVPF